jgi:transcriptional regulator with PAS, ATPase and Fis domain
VGDLSIPLQVKLLRFLQEKTYEPLGSTVSLKADVRVITATNRDLEHMVREGAFRGDLYFRLNILQITLPPLNQRREDVPLLTQHFVQRFRQATGKNIEGLSAEAMAALMNYEFPGNIRELENIIERAFILCGERQIRLTHLPSTVAQAGERPAMYALQNAGALDSVEAVAIKAALERHKGNRTRASKELGIHRTTLLRKLKRLGA